MTYIEGLLCSSLPLPAQYTLTTTLTVQQKTGSLVVYLSVVSQVEQCFHHGWVSQC